MLAGIYSVLCHTHGPIIRLFLAYIHHESSCGSCSVLFYYLPLEDSVGMWDRFHYRSPNLLHCTQV